MTDFLTAAQVAHLTGLPPRHVPTWAAHHRIRPTPTPAGPHAYPAGITRWAAAQDRRRAAQFADRMRLARFITNPLNQPS